MTYSTTTSTRWDSSPRDLILGTAQFFKERGALRPSISARQAEASQRENYEKGLPNNYLAIKGRNDKIRNGDYHFEIVEAGVNPNAPWRHTRLVLD